MRDRAVAAVLVVAAAAAASALLSSDRTVEGCAGTLTPTEMAVGWPRDAYLLVLLGGADREPFAPTRKAVEALGGKVNIRIVDAPPSAKGAAAARGVAAAVLVSPRGKVLARFESPPTAKELSPLVRSPKRSEIVKALIDGDVVVLVWAGPKAPHAKANLKRVREEIKLAHDLYDPISKLITLDPTDPAERTLVENLGIKAAAASEGFVVILPRGRCLPPIRGAIKEDAVLDRLNYLFTVCVFCFPHQFNESLLLEWR